MKQVIALLVMLMGPGAYAAAPAKVLLLPFDSAGPAEQQWVAKALQQNLVAELTRLNSVTPVSGTQAAGGMDQALKAAAAADADYVVFGGYQLVDGDLRMTGQVVDVSKKQAIAGLKTTGTQRDLFGMEDVIANQVKRALPQPVAEAKPEMLKQPAAQPAPAPQAQPEPVVNLNDRARELEQQIDRALDRLRYDTRDVGYPSTSYFYSGISTPYYYYPVYSYPMCVPRHGHNGYHGGHGGASISGSYQGNHFSGQFNVGAGSYRRNYNIPQTANYTNSGRNYNISPTANHANTGRMSAQPHR